MYACVHASIPLRLKRSGDVQRSSVLPDESSGEGEVRRTGMPVEEFKKRK